MRKIIAFGLIVILGFVGTLLCQNSTYSSDSKVRPMPAGTWIEIWGDGKHDNGKHFTNFVSADGRYLRHMVFSKTHTVLELEGVYQIRNNVLMVSVTKASQPDYPTPRTDVGKIISCSTNEIVAEFEDGYQGVRYKRIAP